VLGRGQSRLGRRVVRILDRQRIWAFFKAYCTCYISLVGLFIVIDAFSNMDEFQKRAEGVSEIMKVMGRYYLTHQAAYFDLLGSVIGMMAAIFTVTWMQRNNEHLAMLSAGISTQRAIRPVLFCSVIVSALSVVNQEVIIPRYAEEIQKSHDDDGVRKVQVPSRYDSRGVMIDGSEADRASRTIVSRFNATILPEVFGVIHKIEAKQATYIPPEASRAPLRGGWLIRAATVTPPVDPELLEPGASILTKVNDPTAYPPPLGDPAALKGDTYFLKTTLSFKSMTRKPNWYEYAAMGEALDGLADPASDVTERGDITVNIHFRLLRPILALTLLFMTLPLVLGGYGRNMFINLGFALGNSAMFYGMNLLCKYMGGTGVVPPSLAAWLPLFLFAMLATWRWDRIRT
jgi:lipopolysaccharide export system permease protein